MGLAPGAWPACDSLSEHLQFQTASCPPGFIDSRDPGSATPLEPPPRSASRPLFRQLSDSLVPSPVPHRTLWILSGALSPKSSNHCFSFFSTSPAHHCSPLPALPSCRAAASALPPETADLLPGHHPDCCLQGSPGGQTGYIAYKLTASTLGVYILGPIQNVTQGNHNLRHTHPSVHCSTGHSSRDTEVT